MMCVFGLLHKFDSHFQVSEVMEIDRNEKAHRVEIGVVGSTSTPFSVLLSCLKEDKCSVVFAKNRVVIYTPDGLYRFVSLLCTRHDRCWKRPLSRWRELVKRSVLLESSPLSSHSKNKGGRGNTYSVSKEMPPKYVNCKAFPFVKPTHQTCRKLRVAPDVLLSSSFPLLLSSSRILSLGLLINFLNVPSHLGEIFLHVPGWIETGFL